ncbi:MAG: energy transducer TonB [Bacteriovoracaceae bacterium]
MPRKGWTRTYLYFLGLVFAVHVITFFITWKPVITVYQPKDSASEFIRLKIHKTKKQIVQSEDSPEVREPVEDAFLSDKNRTFDRQTVAKNTDTFKKSAKGNASITQNERGAKEQKDVKNLKLSDMGLAHEYAQTFKPLQEMASESIKGLENGDINESGLSATNDYIEEMTLGDFTQLNTTEFKHYGFYHRIRQKLEQFWGRSIQEKAQALYRSGRHIASQNHITAMVVTLNEKGEILSAEIKTSSGVRELDQAAIESFNQAGPFPNPPKDMLVNGRAVIEWGFVVKT